MHEASGLILQFGPQKGEKLGQVAVSDPEYIRRLVIRAQRPEVRAAAAARTCTDCGRTKPLTDYTAIKGTRYSHTRCKPCRAARARGILPPYSPPTVESVMRTRAKRGPKPKFPPGVRICTECGRMKEVAEFAPIASSRSGYHGRCRACRARLAWERNRPGQRYEDRPVRQADRQPHRSEARPIPSVRSCKECGRDKAIARFPQINRRAAGRNG